MWEQKDIQEIWKVMYLKLNKKEPIFYLCHSVSRHFRKITELAWQKIRRLLENPQLNYVGWSFREEINLPALRHEPSTHGLGLGTAFLPRSLVTAYNDLFCCLLTPSVGAGALDKLLLFLQFTSVHQLIGHKAGQAFRYPVMWVI